MSLDSDRKKDAELRFNEDFVEFVGDPLIEEIEEGLKNGKTLVASIAAGFALTGSTKKINTLITTHALAGADIGRRGTGLAPFKKIKNKKSMTKFVLGSTYGGDKPEPLKKTLLTAAYPKTVFREIAAQAKVNKVWLDAAVAIKKFDPLTVQFPQHLTKMLLASKRALFSNDLEAFRDYTKLVKRSEAQILRLKGKRLQKAYTALIAATKKGSVKAINKAIDRAVNAKLRYQAERIARTELENAYGQARTEEFLKDDHISAMVFRLDSSHTVTDVCDMYAGADLYGLGEGVFPKKESPTLAIHPNGKSSLSPVTVNKISAEKSEKSEI